MVVYVLMILLLEGVKVLILTLSLIVNNAVMSVLAQISLHRYFWCIFAAQIPRKRIAEFKIYTLCFDKDGQNAF